MRNEKCLDVHTGRGHLSATRMSFIVQIFSLLYSYNIVNVTTSIITSVASVIVLLLYLIFLLNKCEHAESIVLLL
jgi:hypothetical protein